MTSKPADLTDLVARLRDVIDNVLTCGDHLSHTETKAGYAPTCRYCQARQAVQEAANALTAQEEQNRFASDFIREVLDAIGERGNDRTVWREGDCVSLKVLALQVVGIIEELKVSAEAAEAKLAALTAGDP